MSYTLVLEWMPGDLYMSAVTARCTAPTSSYSVVWLPPNKVYQITLYCGSTSLVSFLVGAFRGKAWSYMTTKTISLNTIVDVKEFVNIVARYDFEVDLVSGRYHIDGKSIMGIFSLDLSKPIKMEIHSDDCEAFLKEIQRFIVE